MLVSILVAPYCWIYDQGLVIPALLQAAFLTRSRNLLIALAFLSALVEILFYSNPSFSYATVVWAYWTAPAWLAWYLLASSPSTTWGAVWSALTTRKHFQPEHSLIVASVESGVSEKEPGADAKEKNLLGN
jgi:hypothetical protein